MNDSNLIMKYEEERNAAERGIAVVSHEISTQLGLCVTLASHLAELNETLEEKYRSGVLGKSLLESTIAQNKTALVMMNANLDRAVEYLESIKTVASDRCTGAQRLVQIRGYLETIRTTLYPRLKKTQHRLDINCPDSLEAVFQPASLTKAVTNLIVNSLVHAFDSNTSGVMTIDCQLQNSAVSNNKALLTLHYHDSGKGIAPGIKERLFEPFVTTNREAGGTGLGLYLVRSALEETGGTIVYNPTDTGASFTITIPVTLPAAKGTAL